MMDNVENNVRDAAAALLTAIAQARKAGYVVQWPDTPDDLARIAVSETASVAASVVAADAGEVAASEPEPALQTEPQPDATDAPAIPLRSRS